MIENKVYIKSLGLDCEGKDGLTRQTELEDSAGDLRNRGDVAKNNRKLLILVTLSDQFDPDQES